MARMITPTAVQLAPWSLESSDRNAWLELRRQGLGGSDMAAVAGMDPGKTRWSVYLDKVHPELDPGEPGERAAEMMWFGHQMEEIAARRFRLRHPGTKTSRCGMIAVRDAPWMRVNLDYRVRGCPDGLCILEVKNRSAWVGKEWDADGDAEKIPDAPAIQSLWGLIVLGGPDAGYTHAHLLAVIGGNELREYRINYDPALADLLIGEGQWFYNEHVVKRVPPPVDAAERTGKILARLYDADPGSVIVADDTMTGLVERIRKAEDDEQRAKSETALLRHELMTLMGEAEILLGRDGRKLVTWKQNSTFRDSEFRAEQPAELVARYSKTKDVTDTKALAEADPDMYRKYRSRAFRITPAPKERMTRHD